MKPVTQQPKLRCLIPFSMIIALHAAVVHAEWVGTDFRLDTSDPGLWTVDTVHLNSEMITPPEQEAKVINPDSYYEFDYDTQAEIDEFQVRVSEEDMDITRRLNAQKTAMELIPRRKEEQVPAAYAADFELPAAQSGFTEEDWKNYGFSDIGHLTAPERAALDTGVAHGGLQSLRVFFPRASVGPSEGGHQVSLLLEPAEQYYLSYWLKFAEDFSWGGTDHGGKLPGLGQGNLCSGGERCDGTNGFTARYMWRKDGAAVLYLYHMDKPHKWGEDFPLLAADGEPVFFKPGKWIHVEQRVKVNTGDLANGEVQVWVDGAEALNLDGLRFVTGGRKIDTFYVSTFHGGNTPSWGPLNDSYLWIDDIEIGRARSARPD